MRGGVWPSLQSIFNIVSIKTMNKFLTMLFLCLIGTSSYAVLIPYAKEKSSDRIVRASTAQKNEGPFECYECKNDLILRKGKIKTAHFAHKNDPDSTCTGGGRESAEHIFAKQLLKDDLHKWSFVQRCPSCHAQTKAPISFPEANGAQAQIEFRIDKGAKHKVVDVMVLGQGFFLAALEVFHTHAVDEEKAAFFAELDIPILEVSAAQIIEAHNNESFVAELLGASNCRECKAAEERKNQRPCLECRQWDHKDNLHEIMAPYDYKFGRFAYLCDKCHDSRAQRQQIHPLEFGSTWASAGAKRQGQRIAQVVKPKSPEQLAEEQRVREVQQEKRWREQAQDAVNRRDIAGLRWQIAKVPAHVTEIADFVAAQTRIEGELAQEAEAQKLANEKARRQATVQKAKEIVENGKVSLFVTFEKKDLLNRSFARWNPEQKKWEAEANHIRMYRKWLGYDADLLIEHVERLLAEKKSEQKRKAASQKGPASKKATPAPPGSVDLRKFFSPRP